MGIIHVLLHLNDEMHAYAGRTGVVLPKVTPEGRFPTAGELLAVADSFPAHRVNRVNYEQGFELTIESEARVPMEPIPLCTNTSTPASSLDIAVRSFDPDGAEDLSFH